MKIGIIGCGFWAHYQVAAWREADKQLKFAFCDRSIERARAFSNKFSPASYYSDAEKMIQEEDLDLVDIITTPETHATLTSLVANKGIPVICQKPMAPNWESCVQMVQDCQRANIPFFIHENFRWQSPIRKVKQLLDENHIGTPFRARIYFNSAFPVFDNQPNLADLEEMMIADVGVHLFDVCRFLFGEAQSLYCISQRINPKIKGEDVATILLKMNNGVSCTVELSYASIVDYECFPQTLVEVEGNLGFLRLSKNYQLSITTSAGQKAEQVDVINYDWVHPEYAVVHSSMVAINQHFLAALSGDIEVETSGEDNLRTLQLTYAAYKSAKTNTVIKLPAI